MNTAETAAVVTETKTYDRPWMPRGQYFAMLREQGLLKPRAPKANASTSTKAKRKTKAVASDAAKAERAKVRRSIFFANKAKAAKAAGGEQAPKKVYDRPYLPPKQYFAMLRETGQLRPRETQAAEQAA